MMPLFEIESAEILNLGGTRSEPPGVTQVQLWIAIAPGPAAMSDPGRALLRTLTRHVSEIRHAPKDVGQTATYFARWATKRGLTGPWSAGVSMRIV